MSSRSVSVSGIPNGISEVFLQYYFEDELGGLEVTHVELTGPRTAVIEFFDMDAPQIAVSKYFVIRGSELTVSTVGSVSSSAQDAAGTVSSPVVDSLSEPVLWSQDEEADNSKVAYSPEHSHDFQRSISDRYEESPPSERDEDLFCESPQLSSDIHLPVNTWRLDSDSDEENMNENKTVKNEMKTDSYRGHSKGPYRGNSRGRQNRGRCRGYRGKGRNNRYPARNANRSVNNEAVGSNDVHVNSSQVDKRRRGHSPSNRERSEYDVNIRREYESVQSSHSGNTGPSRGRWQKGDSVRGSVHHSTAPGCLAQYSEYSGEDYPESKTAKDDEDTFIHSDCDPSFKIDEKVPDDAPMSTSDHPKGPMESRTLTFNKDKFFFACMALENGDAIKCKTLIEKDDFKIHLTGEKEDLVNASLHVFEFTNQVREVNLPISMEMGQLLTTEKGKEFMSSLGSNMIIQMRGKVCHLMTHGEDPSVLKKKLLSELHTESIKLEIDHINFMKTNSWSKFIEGLLEKYCLVTSTNEMALKVEGVKADTKQAKDGIQQLLRTKVIKEDSITIKKGIYRFLKRHATQEIRNIQHNSAGVNISIETKDSSWHVMLSGPVDSMKKAVTDTHKFIDNIIYEKFEFSRPGLSSLVNKGGVDTYIHGLEQKHSCVIETRASQTTPDIARMPSSRDTSSSDLRIYRTSRPQHRKVRTIPRTPSFMRSSADGVYNNGQVSLHLDKGDITKYQADVLVNTLAGGGVDLDKSGVISKSFSKVAGPQLQQAFSQAVATQSNSNVILTNSFGNLAALCSHVVHLRLDSWRKSSNPDMKLRKELLMCMEHATANNKISIAFPAVGTGGLHYPPQMVAHAFKRAVDDMGIKGVNLKVRLVVFDDSILKKMEPEFSQQESSSDEASSEEDYVQTSMYDRDVSPIRQSPPRNTSEQKVDFHVNAWAKHDVINVQRDIADWLKQNYTDDILLHPTIQYLSEGEMKNIRAKADPGVTLRIDTEKKVIHMEGYILDVMATRRRLTQMIEQIAPDDGNMSLKVELPSYWNSFRNTQKYEALMKSAPKIVTVDKKMLSAVENIIKLTWRADIVGHGQDAVNLSHSKIKVKKVERLENPKLWTAYFRKKNDMVFRNNKIVPVSNLSGSTAVRTDDSKLQNQSQTSTTSEINESWLFHGTNKKYIDKIKHQGLDFRVGSEGGMFGKGIYFAESATKADQYTDDKNARTSGDHTMFLCRVLLGNAFVCTTPAKYQRPPCCQCQQTECNHIDTPYDSVIGTHRTPQTPLLFREFVIYDQPHTYPEIIITYERV